MQVIVLIDRSGSMAGKEDDVKGGFKTFLEEQRNLDANLTVIQFDDTYEVLAKGYIKEISPDIIDKYKPRGGTALLDAIGKSIGEATHKHVLFVMITDGQENASTNYSKQAIKELISAKEKAGWKFVYMGANQDSFTESQNLGISKGIAVNYAESNTRGTMKGLSYVTAAYSAGNDINMSTLQSMVNSRISDTVNVFVSNSTTGNVPVGKGGQR